jgi:hypothetical protein
MKQITAEEKAKELVEFFKPIVYPYMGSGMLTNDYDDGVVLQNAKICASKCVDEIIKELEQLNKPEYAIFITKPATWKDGGLDEESETMDGYEKLEYWQQVKQALYETDRI